MDTIATNAFYEKPEVSPERADFYARLSSRNVAPLWEVLGRLVVPHPKSEAEPSFWKYDELRPLIMEGGRLITAKQAERRVVVLENAGLRGKSQITQTLYAGLQLILPGEVAPTHRHTASALRFIVEGTSAYTAVDGERTMMTPGDFILTPSWTFHDHGNIGSDPVVWLDGLDIPLVNMFDTSFAEHHPLETQPECRPRGDVLHRFGANLLPLDFTPTGAATPLFAYPYARTREALIQVHRGGPVHPSHGVKLQYVNPATGGYPLPTIAAFMQYLPSGFRGQPYRGTDGTLFAVVEGYGESHIGDRVFEWGPRDLFVVPSWVPVSHSAREGAFLFSFSDRAAQKALGLWREEVPARI